MYKTITAGDGGMVVTGDETTYRRCFAFHDQGHSPLRMGVEVGKRPFIGLDLRMTELTGAVVLAQFRKLGTIVSHLRANKRRFKEAIVAAQVSGLAFREITDPDGECATLFGVTMRDGGDIVDARAQAFLSSDPVSVASRTRSRVGWCVWKSHESGCSC
jgi:dTDP-4-amino-4,6-dideoxygalactose transaminase